MTQTGCHLAETDRPDGGEPAWDVAKLFPPQGGWEEDDFLGLPGNHLAELDHGRLEVLRMPSELHQLLVAFSIARWRTMSRRRLSAWCYLLRWPRFQNTG